MPVVWVLQQNPGSTEALVKGICLVLLIPFLRRLIRDREAPADDEPVAVVPAR